MPDQVAAIRDLIRGWSPRSQLVVMRHGERIIDLAEGVTPDDRFFLFSASKAFATVLALQLADDGAVDLDAPIAEVWPEFAEGGKGGITLGDVLRHRTGLPAAGSVVGDVFTMHDSERLLRRIERARPMRRYDPANGAAYQYLLHGPIIAEVARRVTGVGFPELVRRRILDPLGLEHARIGLAPGERAVRMRGDFPGGLVASAYLNRRRILEAVIPSAGVTMPARELATFYTALLADLRGEGPGLVSARRLAAALEPTNDGGVDLFLRRPVAWATGFQLGGERTVPRYAPPFGYRSTELTFGHNGSYVCLAWADVERDLVMALCTDRVPTREVGRRQAAAVSDAVFAYADGVEAD